jgi:hypothetical protein
MRNIVEYTEDKSTEQRETLFSALKDIVQYNEGHYKIYVKIWETINKPYETFLHVKQTFYCNLKFERKGLVFNYCSFIYKICKCVKLKIA